MTFHFLIKYYLPKHLIIFVGIYIVYIIIDYTIFSSLGWIETIKDADFLAIFFPLIDIYNNRKPLLKEYFAKYPASKSKFHLSIIPFLILIALVFLAIFMLISSLLPTHPMAFDYQEIVRNLVQIVPVGIISILIYNHFVYKFLKNQGLVEN